MQDRAQTELQRPCARNQRPAKGPRAGQHKCPDGNVSKGREWRSERPVRWPRPPWQSATAQATGLQQRPVGPGRPDQANREIASLVRRIWGPSLIGDHDPSARQYLGPPGARFAVSIRVNPPPVPKVRASAPLASGTKLCPVLDQAIVDPAKRLQFEARNPPAQ